VAWPYVRMEETHAEVCVQNFFFPEWWRYILIYYFKGYKRRRLKNGMRERVNNDDKKDKPLL